MGVEDNQEIKGVTAAQKPALDDSSRDSRRTIYQEEGYVFDLTQRMIDQAYKPTDTEMNELVQIRYLPAVVKSLAGFEPYIQSSGRCFSSSGEDEREYTFPLYTVPEVATLVLRALENDTNAYSYSAQQRLDMTESIQRDIKVFLERFKAQERLESRAGGRQSPLWRIYSNVWDLAEHLKREWGKKTNTQIVVSSQTAASSGA